MGGSNEILSKIVSIKPTLMTFSNSNIKPEMIFILNIEMRKYNCVYQPYLSANLKKSGKWPKLKTKQKFLFSHPKHPTQPLSCKSLIC